MDTIQQLCWSFNNALRNKGLLLLRCSTVVETGLEALLIAIHLYNHHTFLIRLASKSVYQPRGALLTEF